MKDASNYILTQLYTALNGSVSYGGSNIPYYAITQDVNENDELFIKVASSYEVPQEGTKDSFISDYTIQLDVISVQQNKAVSEVAVNTISNDIRVILKPNPTTLGVNSNSDFKTIDLTFDNPRSFQNQDGESWRIRKVLNINFKIVQL